MRLQNVKHLHSDVFSVEWDALDNGKVVKEKISLSGAKRVVVSMKNLKYRAAYEQLVPMLEAQMPNQDALQPAEKLPDPVQVPEPEKAPDPEPEQIQDDTKKSSSKKSK